MEPLLTAIQDFSKRAREAEQERNRMVHAHWAVDPNGSLLRVKYTARGKKGFNEQQEPVTAEDIAAVYGRVADAASSCSPILGELLNRFPMMGGNLTVELGAV